MLWGFFDCWILQGLGQLLISLALFICQNQIYLNMNIHTDWYKDPKTGMPNSVFYAPYSNTLETSILQNFKIDKEQLNVTSEGVPGQCAVNMIDRFHKCLDKNKKIKYDLVLILAGTNDIALVKDVQKIIDSIIGMHEICLENGIKSILMTIPECEKQSDEGMAKRNKINEAIKEYATKKDIEIFDLYDKFKYHSLDDKDKELYWNDGLHFSPKGYEHWGEMLYDFLRPCIQKVYETKFNASTDAKS